MTDYLPTATDRDVHITRVFDAPVAVVWKFWTDPALLAQWFGPHAVSVDPATVEVDAREGGVWKLAMHNENGSYPLEATITRLIENEYFEGILSADTGMGEVERVHLRVQFHDHGEKTRITMVQGPFDPEFLDPTREGWTESFEKIDALIAGGAA